MKPFNPGEDWLAQKVPPKAPSLGWGRFYKLGSFVD